MIIALTVAIAAGSTSYTAVAHPELFPFFITVALATGNGVWVGSLLVTRPAHRTKTTRRHGKPHAARTTRHVRQRIRSTEPQVTPTTKPENPTAELLSATIPPSATIAWQDAIALEEALRVYGKDDPPPRDQVIWEPTEEKEPIG